MPITENKLTNFAVKEATTIPQLVANLEAIDPNLAKQLETKTLFASKTPYAQAVVSVLAIVSTKYGVGWDDATEQMIAGGIIILANWVVALIMRYITKQPIAGIINTPPSSIAIVPATIPVMTIDGKTSP